MRDSERNGATQPHSFFTLTLCAHIPLITPIGRVYVLSSEGERSSLEAG
jgi:hypothetical protein